MPPFVFWFDTVMMQGLGGFLIQSVQNKTRGEEISISVVVENPRMICVLCGRLLEWNCGLQHDLKWPGVMVIKSKVATHHVLHSKYPAFMCMPCVHCMNVPVRLNK